MAVLIGKEERAVMSMPGNERRVAQAWVHVRGGMRVFAVQLRHSVQWLVMPTLDPKHVRNNLWFKEKCMFIDGPEGRTCHLPIHGPQGESIERTFDYVIASRSLQGKFKNMEVAENFETRPHKAVTFLVERDKVVSCQVEVRQKVGCDGWRRR